MLHLKTWHCIKNYIKLLWGGWKHLLASKIGLEVYDPTLARTLKFKEDESDSEDVTKQMIYFLHLPICLT